MSGCATRIIGIGNPLMGDDGIGIVAIEQLQRQAFPATVELIDAGCGGLNLLPLLAECQHAIIIDAADFAGSPGSLLQLTGADLDKLPARSARLSSHQPGLAEILAISKMMHQLPQLTLLFVQVESCQQKYALSAAVSAALPTLLQNLRSILPPAT